MKSDFFDGLRLMLRGLSDAAKKASYSLGFGTISLGLTLFWMNQFSVDPNISKLISLGTFLVFARIGRSVDDYLDRKSIEAPKSVKLLSDGKK